MCDPVIGAITIVYITNQLTKFPDRVSMLTPISYAFIASIIYANMWKIRDSVQQELVSFTDPNREDVQITELFSQYGFLLVCFLAFILYKVKEIVKRFFKSKKDKKEHQK